MSSQRIRAERRRAPACLWGAAAALALLAGCDSGASAEGGGEGRPPALVEVAEARGGALELERTYLGMVRAVSRAELAAGADGEIVEVAVREGDRVDAGDELLRIDPDLASAQLRAAAATAERTQAERQQAAREAQRFRAAGPRTVAEVEIQRAAASAEALEAQTQSSAAEVARARAALARHRVTAPFAGIIAARHVDPGDWVSPGTLALELVAEGQTEIIVRVEPELLADVDVGSEAELSRGGRTATATVAGVVRALDPETRTATLRLRADQAPWLLPGSAVDVRFTLVHETDDGVVVPRDALVVGVAQTRVVKVVDGQAAPVNVEVIERGVDAARVRGEGLSAGDVLVTRGNDRLRPGQPVRVAE